MNASAPSSPARSCFRSSSPMPAPIFGTFPASTPKSPSNSFPAPPAFFEKDVPSAFSDVTDPAVKSAFAESNAAAIKLLREYQEWLKADLLPLSTGDFRIGAEAFSKKLAYEEMVTTPLDRLLEIGLADLHKNQSE